MPNRSVRRGAGQDAIAQLEQAGHLAGEDASLWVRLAEMHLDSGQPDLARQDAEQALNSIRSCLPLGQFAAG